MSEEAVVVGFSKPIMVGCSLACLGAAALPWLDAGRILVGDWLFTATGLAAAFVIIGLFCRGPALVVDKEGIIDRSSWIAVGRVPWSEIRGFRRRWWGCVLEIDLHDPRGFAKRSSVLLRLLWTLNRFWIGSPVALLCTVLEIDSLELESTLRRFFDRAKSRV